MGDQKKQKKETFSANLKMLVPYINNCISQQYEIYQYKSALLDYNGASVVEDFDLIN